MSTTLAAILIVGSAFLTSVLSGVIGMAGGVILIAVLVVILPVPSAMILHGILQGVANGTRSWLLRQHILWHILPAYLGGAVIVGTLFGFATIVVDAAIILIVVGCFPWISQFLPKRFALDITKRPVAFLCGGLITAAQLIAGASGPLLDAFYQRADLTRYQIVASKALTQTLGHIFKIFYFIYIVVMSHEHEVEELSWWLIVIAITGLVIGTRFGTQLLSRLTDDRFIQITNYVVLLIGAVVALRGLFLLFQ